MANIIKLVNKLLIFLIYFISCCFCQSNILTMSGHTQPIFSLAALPDGNLVSGSADDVLKIWDTTTGVLKLNLTGHTGNIYSVITLKNTTYIASGSGDKTIRIWNQATGAIIQSITTNRVISALAALPDGTLFSGAYDYLVTVYTGENPWTKSTTLSNHTAGINAVVLLKDSYMATASDDQTVKIWNYTSGNVIYSLTNHTGPVFCLTVLQDYNLASGSLDNSINIWNPYRGVLIRKLTGHTGSVNALGVLSNGNLVSASNDRTIKIWNINTGVATYTLNNHTNGVNALAILANGFIASGSSDLKIKIWNTTNITSPPLSPIISHGSVIKVNMLILGNIFLIYLFELFY